MGEGVFFTRLNVSVVVEDCEFVFCGPLFVLEDELSEVFAALEKLLLFDSEGLLSDLMPMSS